MFNSFSDNGGSFPQPLCKTEEERCLYQYHNGTFDEQKEAKNLLITHNLRLVAHVAKKYINIKDNEELISVGSIGLIKGITSFKPEKGVKLATYVSRCIDNAILTKRGVLAHMMSIMHLLRKNGTSLTALVANFT